MIDIHCHILPGIDDGAPDIETSMKMAQIAFQDGIRAIIATPHVGDNGLKRDTIVEKTIFINRELKARQIGLRVFPGAEIQSHLAMHLAADHILAKSRYILIEFPHAFLPSDSTRLIRTLRANDYRVIVAHVERNSTITFDPEKVTDLIRAGAQTQITAESITGFLGPDNKRCADYLLKKGWVHFIATDSHSPRFRRPALSHAVKVASRIVGKTEAIRLVLENPKKILLQK